MQDITLALALLPPGYAEFDEQELILLAYQIQHQQNSKPDLQYYKATCLLSKITSDYKNAEIFIKEK